MVDRTGDLTGEWLSQLENSECQSSMGEGKGISAYFTGNQLTSRLWCSSVGLVIYLFILKTLWLQVGGGNLTISGTELPPERSSCDAVAPNTMKGCNTHLLRESKARQSPFPRHSLGDKGQASEWERHDAVSGVSYSERLLLTNIPTDCMSL